ncbi:MAG TPA: hypothetical protein DCP55_00220 [Chitinophagaceae bacterium]|nr:hypothetical protein [Chitinophagaceae bacterium]
MIINALRSFHDPQRILIGVFIRGSSADSKKISRPKINTFISNITENSAAKKSKTWIRESENLLRYCGSKGRGAWYFRGQVNGKEIRKRLWATSKTAARQAALDVQRNFRDSAGKVTHPLKGYVQRYLHQRATIKKPETAKKDIWVLNEFSCSYPDFEKTGIHEVTPESLNCWLNDLQVRRIQGGHRFSERTKKHPSTNSF